MPSVAEGIVPIAKAILAAVLAALVAWRRAVPRGLRGLAAVSALLAGASVACRTPEATRRAAPAGAPLGVRQQERPVSPRTVAAPFRVLAVDPAARVVVAPSGRAYLVLRVCPEALPDGVAWTVLYHAGDDAEDPTRPGAEARLASAAGELVEAFGPFAELAGIGRVSVTALFGKPGDGGSVEQRWFTRDTGPWRADGARRLAMTQVPAIDMDVVRDRDAEARALRVAAEFVSEADRADYDAAWSRTSALAKATMTRADFERCLSALHHAAAAGDPSFYLALPASGEPLVPGSVLEGWFARKLEDGLALEALMLRLDDDLEWRVASVVELTPTSVAGPAAAAPADVSEI